MVVLINSVYVRNAFDMRKKNAKDPHWMSEC